MARCCNDGVISTPSCVTEKSRKLSFSVSLSARLRSGPPPISGIGKATTVSIGWSDVLSNT